MYNYQPWLFVDAQRYGNESRFFNNSCTPNVTAKHVFKSYHDALLPAIAYYTTRDVEVGEELSLQYAPFARGRRKACRNGCVCFSPHCYGGPLF